MKNIAIFVMFAALVSLQAFAQSSTITGLPNGNAIQPNDAFPIARCATAGCNFKVLGSRMAIAATSPLILNSATGNMSCPTCSVGSSTVNSFSAGTTGFTPSSPTIGNVTLAGILNVVNGGTGNSGGDLSALFATASGTTTSLTIAQQVALTVDAQQFGAIQDGTTDDTTAINAAISAVSTYVNGNAKVGYVNLHGPSLVCGLVVKRNVVLNFVGGSLTVKNGCATSPPIASENYATNKASGQTNICGISPLVPSWFGFNNAKINCNLGSASYTGECVGFYGAKQLLTGVNQIYNAKNASYPQINTIDANGGNSFNNPQCQEEATVDTLITSSGGGQGWWNTTHDLELGAYIGAANADCSFVGGGIDSASLIHTYAESNGCGQVYTSDVQIDTVMTDGDTITIGTSSPQVHIKQLWLFNVGYNSETYGINNQGTGTVIDSATCDVYSGATNATCAIWGTAGQNYANNTILGNFYTNGSTATGMKGIVNYSNFSFFTNMQIGNFSGTGGVGFSENGAGNTISGKINNSKIDLLYSGTGGDNVDVAIFTNSGQVSVSGTPTSTDNFRVFSTGSGTNSNFNNFPSGNSTTPGIHLGGDLTHGIFGDGSGTMGWKGYQFDLVDVGTTGGTPQLTIENTSGITNGGAFGASLKLDNHISAVNPFILSQIDNSSGHFVIANGNSPFQAWLTIDQSGNSTFCCGNVLTPSLEISANTIEEYVTNGNAQIAINYNGYLNGATQFRDLAIYNGKNSTLMTAIGSTGAVNVFYSLGVRYQAAAINVPNDSLTHTSLVDIGFNGGSDYTAFYSVGNGAASASPTFDIANGNLGIGVGTTTPAQKLTVKGATSNLGLFQSTGANNSVVTLDNAAGGQLDAVLLLDAGVAKWNFGKDTANNFYVGDNTLGLNLLLSAPGSQILQVGGTGSFNVPIGTTAQRPATGVNGMLRYNSTTAALEGYINNAWSSIDAIPLPVAVTSGGTGLSSTTANQILYSSATSTIAGLATANNGMLVTNGSGVPSIAAAGTGLSIASSSLSSNAEQTIDYQPGLLTSVNSTKGSFTKFVKASTVDNITGSAITFSCVSNPTITLTNCHSDTSCVTTPTVIGTVTVTAAGQAFDGSVSSASIAAGEYVAWSITAGTCASLDVAATAQIHSN